MIEDPEEQFEAIGPLMDAKFSGRCAIDWDHRIRRGDVVTRVAWADNPLLPVPGVACKNCTKFLKKSRN